MATMRYNDLNYSGPVHKWARQEVPVGAPTATGQLTLPKWVRTGEVVSRRDGPRLPHLVPVGKAEWERQQAEGGAAAEGAPSTSQPSGAAAAGGGGGAAAAASGGGAQQASGGTVAAQQAFAAAAGFAAPSVSAPLSLTLTDGDGLTEGAYTGGGGGANGGGGGGGSEAMELDIDTDATT